MNLGDEPSLSLGLVADCPAEFTVVELWLHLRLPLQSVLTCVELCLCRCAGAVEFRCTRTFRSWLHSTAPFSRATAVGAFSGLALV